MATVEGLNLRGSRWYVRIIIPDDLRKFYGKDRVNLALGTSDRPTAVVMGTLKRAEWLADFQARRSEANPAPVEVVTPELARVLAARVRAAVLRTAPAVTPWVWPASIAWPMIRPPRQTGGCPAEPSARVCTLGARVAGW